MRENMEVSLVKLTNWITWTRKRKDPGNKQESGWPEGYHADTASEAGIKKGEWVWVKRSLHYRTHPEVWHYPITESNSFLLSLHFPQSPYFIYLTSKLHFEMVWFVAIIIFSFRTIKTRAIVMDSGRMWPTEEKDLLAKKNESVKKKQKKERKEISSTSRWTCSWFRLEEKPMSDDTILSDIQKKSGWHRGS